jgi:hypothetical protein
MTRRSFAALCILVLLPAAALAGLIPAPPAIVAMWEGENGAAVRDSLRRYVALGAAKGASASMRLEGGEAAYWMGVQDARAGRADSAIAQWRRAWTLRGDFDEGFALVDALVRRARKGDVEGAYGVAAVLADQSRLGMPRRAPEAHARLAWTLHLRGKTDSAIAIAREWCGPIQGRPFWTRRLTQLQLAAGDTAAAWRWLATLSARTRGTHPETEAQLRAAQRALHYNDERRTSSVVVIRDPMDTAEERFLSGLRARLLTVSAADGFHARTIVVPANARVARREHVLFVLSPTDTLPAADTLAAALAAAGHPVTLLAPRGTFGAVSASVTGPETWAGRESEWLTVTTSDAGRVMDATAARDKPESGWIVGAGGGMAPVALALARSRKDVKALLLTAPHLPLVEVAEYRARLKAAGTRMFIQVGPEEPLALETADLISRATLAGQVRVADSGREGKGAALFRAEPRVMQRFLAWLEEKPAPGQ